MALTVNSSKKNGTFLSFIAIAFALTSASADARSAFCRVNSTPYDHQMARVSPTLEMSSAPMRSRMSMVDVNHWVTRLHELPYQYSRKWRTPRELRLLRNGDCKAKAIALYAAMRSKGAHNVYLVIGKRHFMDSRTHAWLQWQTANGTYLLDPTFNCTVARMEQQATMSTYIPFYAYAGVNKYRATFAPLLASGDISAVSQAPNRSY